MATDKKERPKENAPSFSVNNNSPALWLAGVFSFFWAFTCFWYVNRNWKDVSKLQPEEVATVMTGIVAPIGIAFLVASVLIQRAEFRSGVRVLEGQSDFLDEQTTAMQELARASKMQAEHLEAQLSKLKQASRPIFEISDESVNEAGIATVQITHARGEDLRSVTFLPADNHSPSMFEGWAVGETISLDVPPDEKGNIKGSWHLEYRDCFGDLWYEYFVYSPDTAWKIRRLLRQPGQEGQFKNYANIVDDLRHSND